MNNAKEYHKDLDLLDLIQMFIKNKRMIISITIILTLICLGLVYFLDINNKGSILRSSTINILVEDDGIYDSITLLEDLNNRITSAINYEKWRNKNPDLSKFLSQSSASTLLVINKTQTINFNYSSQQNLNAKISYVSYTTGIVLKKILLKQENKIQKYQVNLSKRIEEIKKKSNKDIKYFKEISLNKISNYENTILELAHEIEVAKFKSDFFSKYNSKIDEMDEDIFLSLMNNESILLVNKNEMSLIKNMIADEKTRLENFIKDEKIRLQNDIDLEKKNFILVDVIHPQIISIGQVTSNESLVVNNRDFLYLLVPLISVLSFIFLLVFCFFKEEYNKSLIK